MEFVRPVFFVRWSSPKATDIPAIIKALAQAHEALARPVVYVAIAPENSEPPDDRVRKAFTSRMDEVLGHCESMHFVMEGQGFKNSILRNALATVLMVRGQRNKVFVHRTLDEALIAANGRLDPKFRFDQRATIQRAQSLGVATKTSANAVTQ
jgi:hypothetical protein